MKNGSGLLPTPVATPNLEDDPEVLAAFRAMFNPPTYQPQAALAKALELLPPDLHNDPYWLPFTLLLANSGQAALFQKYIYLKTRRLDPRIWEHLGKLSHGDEFLATLGLHLFNDDFACPSLIGLRLLDNWHFELAMHAIRLSAGQERK